MDNVSSYYTCANKFIFFSISWWDWTTMDMDP